MSSFAEALFSVPSRCQSCDARGFVAGHGKQSWCECPPRKLGGPYVVAPGVVVRCIYESADQKAFREQCRLAGNAFIDAKNALCERWVRCGRGWRELPRGHAKRERLETAYRTAKRELSKLQKVCPHEHRSMFDETGCDVCHADLEARS